MYIAAGGGRLGGRKERWVDGLVGGWVEDGCGEGREWLVADTDLYVALKGFYRLLLNRLFFTFREFGNDTAKGESSGINFVTGIFHTENPFFRFETAQIGLGRR